MFHFVSPNDFPLRHISCGKLLNSESFLHGRRTLDSFVLLIGNRGRLYIAQDETRYVVEPGTFAVLFPGHEHYGYALSSGALSYYWCHFHVRGSYELMGRTEMNRYLYVARGDAGQNGLSDVYILPEFGRIAAPDRISLAVRQLLDLAARGAYSPGMADCALSLLVMELTQGFMDTTEVSADMASKSQRNIIEIMDWIRANHSQPLNVLKVAEQWGYNPDYLSTTFRQVTGLPLLKYIHKTRVAAAKQLLLGTSRTVREIAAETGFSDEKNFMKVFKSLEDVTPSQYRRAYYHIHLNR